MSTKDNDARLISCTQKKGLFPVTLTLSLPRSCTTAAFDRTADIVRIFASLQQPGAQLCRHWSVKYIHGTQLLAHASALVSWAHKNVIGGRRGAGCTVFPIYCACHCLAQA
eukprot:354988-Chlamydomonas_euryale.AAC.4